MPLPNFPDKLSSRAIIEPEGVHKYRASLNRLPTEPPPKSVILLYSTDHLQHFIDVHGATPYSGRFGSSLYALPKTNGEVAVLGRVGIGAPVICMYVEDLIAWGCKVFLHVGFAGSIHPDVIPGDIVVCDRSIRDEGVSHHYLPSAEFSEPDADLTTAFCKTLQERGITHSRKPNWTIDAIYRETVNEVLHYQGRGIATVEMETAALFAVTRFRGVKMAATFVISDSLASCVWDPHFHNPIVNDRIRDLADVGLEFLQTLRVS